jgi:FkbM family methyltransferase
MSADFDAKRAAALIGLLSPARVTRIVDVGANPLDVPPYQGLLKMGGCEVWGFEPQEEALEKLRRDAGAGEHYLPYVVGDGSGGTLRVCADSGFTSLLEPSGATMAALGQFKDRAKVVERLEVETVRLDDIADLPEFDLLKIDVQGGECAVFEHGQARLSGAVAVISEVSALPIYEEQPLLPDQAAILGKMGFGLHKFLFLKSFGFRSGYCHRLRRKHYRSQLGDGDAVFVRHLFGLERLEDEALKHLAILADAVFLSQDLGVAALGVLAGRGRITPEQVHDYIDLLPETTQRPERAGPDTLAAE